MSADAGSDSMSSLPYKEAKQQLVDSFSRSYISDLLSRTGGNVSEAARNSGLSRVAVQKMLARFDLKSSLFKKIKPPMSTEKIFRQEKAFFSIEGINSIWEAVLDKAVQSSLPKDHELEANHPDYFFFLLKGAVKLSCLSESGQERVVMRIGPGTLFNEVSHIHTSLFQSHSLHTLEECVVARFPKSILEDKDFFRQHPELACNLIHSLGIKAGAFFAQLLIPACWR